MQVTYNKNKNIDKEEKFSGRGLIPVIERICKELRSVMDVSEYKHYVLGFLFYKYLSEIIEKEINKHLLKWKITFKELKENHPKYNEIKQYLIDNKIGFFIDYKYTYQNILELINEGKNILGILEKAFSKIEESSIGHESEDDFKGLFQEVKLDDTKLGKIESAREATVKFIIKELSTLDLATDHESKDFFGEAYEYLLSSFASDSGKKAGEFYTPSTVADLIVKIATYGKETFIDAYDPTCGSGSLLLKLTKNVKNYNKIYGQEVKASTFNLARMNLFLRGMNFSNFDIKEGDTLLNPRHKDKKFECIVANPPFSLKWKPTDILSQDERFNSYPAMAPKDKADFAFLQHMLYYVEEKKGIIVSVFSLGTLERGKAELKIRKYIVDNNWIDTIILLPSKMFYNTSIPTCLVVARKNKKDDKIFFIDASNEFVSCKRQNQLSKENIDKIFNAWKNKEEIKNFSKLISIKQIIDKDYSLSINKYVKPKEEHHEIIDIKQVEKDLNKIQKEIKKLEEKFENNLANYLAENK